MPAMLNDAKIQFLACRVQESLKLETRLLRVQPPDINLTRSECDCIMLRRLLMQPLVCG